MAGVLPTTDSTKFHATIHLSANTLTFNPHVQPSRSNKLSLRQGASAQGRGKRRSAGVAHMHTDELKRGHGRQRARAQPLRQPLHAVWDACWAGEEGQQLERWQHRSQLAQQRQVGRF